MVLDSRRFSTFFFWLPVFCLLCVWNSPGQASGDKFIKVYFSGGGAVTAELAVSDEEKQLGLMFRESIEPDQGMLFVFGEEGIQSFWMKNTLIPLDMFWLDREKRVVHIEPNVPPCPKDPCPSYQSNIPAMYVLELKAGSSEARKIKLYDRLDFVLPSRVGK
jgi:uncharacterized membrane protein (UPF0127 family)